MIHLLAALTPEVILTQLVTVFVTLAGAGAVAGYMLRGFWETKVTPLVQREIKAHSESPDTTNGTKTKTIKEVADWYDARPQREARLKEQGEGLYLPLVREDLEKIIHQKIDNEIKRSDGLIAREVSNKVDESVQSLRDEVIKLTKFFQEDAALKTQLLQRMSRLEGVISWSQRQSNESTSQLPAVKDPTK